MRSDVLDVIGPPTPFGTTATPTVTYTPGLYRRPTPPPTVNWQAGTQLRIMSTGAVWLRVTPSASESQHQTLANNNAVTATGNKHYDGHQWWWEVQATWGAVGWVEQYSLVER